MDKILYLKDTIIKTLENAGKRTLFVLQAPELPRSIEYLIPREKLSTLNGVSLEWWNKRMEFVYENIEELQVLTEIIDLAGLFCGEETCLAVQDGKALYFDDDHMSLDGARRAVKVIIPFIHKSDE